MGVFPTRSPAFAARNLVRAAATDASGLAMEGHDLVDHASRTRIFAPEFHTSSTTNLTRLKAPIGSCPTVSQSTMVLAVSNGGRVQPLNGIGSFEWCLS